jgi:hypothetical protein
LRLRENCIYALLAVTGMDSTYLLSGVKRVPMERFI